MIKRFYDLKDGPIVSDKTLEHQNTQPVGGDLFPSVFNVSLAFLFAAKGRFLVEVQAKSSEAASTKLRMIFFSPLAAF